MDMNLTTILIEKKQHKRIKLISVIHDKKIYELIEEAIQLLELKYRNIVPAGESNE